MGIYRGLLQHGDWKIPRSPTTSYTQIWWDMEYVTSNHVINPRGFLLIEDHNFFQKQTAVYLISMDKSDLSYIYDINHTMLICVSVCSQNYSWQGDRGPKTFLLPACSCFCQIHPVGTSHVNKQHWIQLPKRENHCAHEKPNHLLWDSAWRFFATPLRNMSEFVIWDDDRNPIFLGK